MTDQRHRTTIEIQVDDNGVKKLGQTVQQALDPQAAQAFAQAVERTTGAVQGLQEALERQERARELATMRAKESANERREVTRMERLAREKSRIEARNQAEKKRAEEQQEKEGERREQERQRSAMAFITGASAMIGAAAAGSFTATLASAIPGIGPAAGGVLSGIQGFYQEYASAQTAFTRAMAPSGLDTSQLSQEQFTRFGLGPNEAAGAVGSLAGRSGREGRDLADILPTQLRLQNLLGVQGAAGLIGAEESRGGRAANASKLMVQAVSTGLEAGIRTTRLDAYLGNISSWVEQVRTEGIDFSAESALQLVRGFSALGPAFAGEAGALRARQLPEALKSAADQGGIGGALSFEAARRVLGPKASIEDLLDLTEGGGSKDQAAQFQRQFLELARGASGNDVLGLRYLMRSVGMNMSIPQLRAIASGDLMGFTDAEASTAAAERKLGGRQALHTRMSEPMQHAAELAFKRVGVGGEAAVQGAARNTMENDVEMAKLLVSHVAPLIEKTTDMIKLLLKGEVQQVVGGALNTVGGVIGLDKLGDDWQAGIKDGFLSALREFFGMDTFRFGIAPAAMEVTERLAKGTLPGLLITTAVEEAGKALSSGQATDAAAPKPALPPPKSDVPGPQGALLPGGIPQKMRDAARLFETIATEFERSVAPSDGTLGFG